MRDRDRLTSHSSLCSLKDTLSSAKSDRQAQIPRSAPPKLIAFFPMSSPPCRLVVKTLTLETADFRRVSDER